MLEAREQILRFAQDDNPETTATSASPPSTPSPSGRGPGEGARVESSRAGQEAAAVDDGNDPDCVFFNSVLNPVIADEQFSVAEIGQIGRQAAALRERNESISGFEHPVNESIRGLRRVAAMKSEISRRSSKRGKKVKEWGLKEWGQVYVIHFGLRPRAAVGRPGLDSQAGVGRFS
jgi:hypothetical protein